MPLIRFDLIEGQDEKSLRNLLDASHRAMVKVFGVPKRERYKIVHQHPTNELIIKDIGL
ncbi:4-oxalocrotonate tautomerase family protein [Neobacillus pocheonensis]|uniref:4-oxalocrotonate tautomerase family protein n=1 Tax=Neobacillus pocheonensis TaxID=363869 RepID=A0ABT0WHC6_9BACI|nr:4-oxalocrotonate tautomerase family protein [Neobacillus pocheonensis]